jgi:hypothetical protein
MKTVLLLIVIVIATAQMLEFQRKEKQLTFHKNRVCGSHDLTVGAGCHRSSSMYVFFYGKRGSSLEIIHGSSFSTVKLWSNSNCTGSVSQNKDFSLNKCYFESEPIYTDQHNFFLYLNMLKKTNLLNFVDENTRLFPQPKNQFNIIFIGLFFFRNNWKENERIKKYNNKIYI